MYTMLLSHTLQNISNGGYGGAIIAALYLDEFVGVSSKPADSSSSSSSSKPAVKKPTWIHLDFMAFNVVRCCCQLLTTALTVLVVKCWQHLRTSACQCAQTPQYTYAVCRVWDQTAYLVVFVIDSFNTACYT
jgi:hypothetical protein